ncbi:hypothetical protein BHE74_00048550 [Ensete ventricosum]|nr:hypothetical protein GW17_00039514 [Ensete ventricosum]RWW45598.1 hypothetical protein BHE74_00048550 [Ensete ventricosum]
MHLELTRSLCNWTGLESEWHDQARVGVDWLRAVGRAPLLRFWITEHYCSGFGLPSTATWVLDCRLLLLELWTTEILNSGKTEGLAEMLNSGKTEGLAKMLNLSKTEGLAKMLNSKLKD